MNHNQLLSLPLIVLMLIELSLAVVKSRECCSFANTTDSVILIAMYLCQRHTNYRLQCSVVLHNMLIRIIVCMATSCSCMFVTQD